MKKLITGILVTSVFLMSCSTIQQSSTAKVMDIYGSGIIQYPIVGEIDVDIKKVTGKSGSGTSSNISTLKINAVNNAIKNADADILVEPVFDIINDDGNVSVTVEGFPGTYTNFRPATEKDIPILEVGKLQVAETYESTETEVKNNDSFLVTLALGLGAIGILGYLISAN